MEDNVILQVRDLKQWFPLSKMFYEKQQYVKAVNGVSFDLHRGETLGIAGESGCGKSTLLRSCIRLLEPTDGQVMFEEKDITHMKERNLRLLDRLDHLLRNKLHVVRYAGHMLCRIEYEGGTWAKQ